MAKKSLFTLRSIYICLKKALGIYFGAKKKRCLHQKAMQAAVVGDRTSIIARR